jgi:hypothetical protein
LFLNPETEGGTKARRESRRDESALKKSALKAGKLRSDSVALKKSCTKTGPGESGGPVALKKSGTKDEPVVGRCPVALKKAALNKYGWNNTNCDKTIRTKKFSH